MIHSVNAVRGLAVAGMLMAGGIAEAQTCIGLPRTSLAPVNISATMGMPENATILGGRLGLGGENAFGGVSVGYVDYDGASSASATTFGGDVGYAVPINSARTTHLCPVVQLSYRNGPNVGSTESNGLGLVAGVALGGEVNVSPTFSLVPHAIAGVSHQRASFTSGSGNETERSETGGQIGAGLSLRFNQIFVITPSVGFPVGFDGDTDPVFSLGMSLGFRGEGGGRRR